MSTHGKIRLEHPERCLGCYSCVFACSLELFNEISATRTAITIKPCSVGDVFTVNFCTACEDPPCVKSCKPRALQQDSEGKLELVKPSECDKCETFDCIKACTIGALLIDPETNKPIMCTQCGKCAEICPHEVIAYEEAKR